MSKDHNFKEIPSGKQSLKRPRLSWEGCIKYDVKKLDPDL